MIVSKDIVQTRFAIAAGFHNCRDRQGASAVCKEDL
nr:MAG TPA: hypothetical protein [Caudoviricetes sp.]